MNRFIERIKEGGSQPAIISHQKTYSYKELYDQIEAYGNLLQKEVQPAETVALIADYSFETVALFFALYLNRNIIVPIATTVSSEIESRMQTALCDCSIAIKNSNLDFEKQQNTAQKHPLIQQLVENKQAGLILFSSGSTGAPKAMIHNLDNLIDAYPNKYGKHLVFLIFLLFDHIGGINTLLKCLSMGITMVLPEERTPEHIAMLIDHYKINVLPASPTFLNLMLINQVNQHYDLSSLRLITYGTESMPEGLLLKLKEAFPRVKFQQTFGTSETGIAHVSSQSSTSTAIKIDNADTEYKIVDGELWLRSKTQIMGYLNADIKRFTADGWFKTGDLVEQLPDGYLRIVGRNRDQINVGGQKVVPSEVESLLFQMPNVQDCIVYGEPNPITGQMVAAKIMFSQPLKASEAKKNIALFCHGKIEPYKIPAKIVIMTESEFSERFKKKRG